MPYTLKKSIYDQRALITNLVGARLKQVAIEIGDVMNDRQALDVFLRDTFSSLDHCKYLYVLNDKGVQLSSTVNRFGSDEEDIGRDRSMRPYMQNINDDFKLSDAYISRNKKRPSLTAIQVMRHTNGQLLGYLGVDYDMREMPHSKVIYEEPSQWRQIKGDPAIRGGLFRQHRVESMMDQHIDHVLAVHADLMVYQGVHHFQVHFSSSRTTIWHRDDPYIYHILTMDELLNTDICLAYPSYDYIDRAAVPIHKIKPILQQFKALRFADDTVYLRSASLNIINGKIGLNFSCDGTHYINYDEFLEKGLHFWFGNLDPQACPEATLLVGEEQSLDAGKLEQAIEALAAEGCIHVNKVLQLLEKDSVPNQLLGFNANEREYIYKELRSIMDVYDGGLCGI